ncbi:transposon tf2-6 polyprotein [Plakobranchus ocellatus]|uniref:Transposon tf2-6 polyprotein n=1 Tax=Plakobranchus ocellatus TaxID=259542 RepID=A0AAV4BDU2_9GAST|nr:transposon tf2-6 polyprotein [Plakobranchus ocellatus]
MYGTEPNPAKVSAIKEMPPPQNQAQLRTLCGMFNYLTGFVKNIADTLKLVTDLLQKDRAFRADPENRTYLVNSPAGVLRLNRKPLQSLPKKSSGNVPASGSPPGTNDEVDQMNIYRLIFTAVNCPYH